jgi:glycosyltransferase involved in cell wall biosynthesis
MSKGPNKKMKISICMPTHEMQGVGATFLQNSLKSIEDQTYSNIEVIISDQSTDDEIYKVYEFWKNKLNIKYFRFNGERKPTANMNNAMKLATGDIIKPLFIDDFFYSPKALELIADSFENNPDNGWTVVACCHKFEDEPNSSLRQFMVPAYHDNIHMGNNTISCPSVAAVRRTEDLILFDEQVRWLMDVEWYKRLHGSLGLPCVIDQTSMVIRIHSSSCTSELESQHEVKQRDYTYVFNKHNT